MLGAIPKASASHRWLASCYFPETEKRVEADHWVFPEVHHKDFKGCSVVLKSLMFVPNLLARVSKSVVFNIPFQVLNVPVTSLLRWGCVLSFCQEHPPGEEVPMKSKHFGLVAVTLVCMDISTLFKDQVVLDNICCCPTNLTTYGPNSETFGGNFTVFFIVIYFR